MGYADGRLLDHLRSLGADLGLAEEIGLIARGSDGKLYDAIPAGYLVYVHRRAGAVEYLSGRATFTDDPHKKARNLAAPKLPYWLVRNYDWPLVVVEGQADANTTWQWDYNVVALCGVAVGDEDAATMRRFKAIYLALDSDQSGREKTRTIADQLDPLTMIVPSLPEKPGDGKEKPRYKDLNEWATQGQATRDDLVKLLTQAQSWLDQAIEAAAAAPAYEADERLDHLAGLVARLPAALRGKYTREICANRKLATPKDFRALLAAHGGENNNGNGGYDVQDGHHTCYGEALINGVARITHELTLDDGSVPTVVYTIAGQLDSGEPLEPIEVKAEDFEGMRWIARHWGARPIVYVPPGRAWQLRRAIQEHSRFDLVRERVYMHTGWATVGGRRVYLTTSGALGADGLDPDVRVDLGQTNLRHYALPAPPPDLRLAVQASLDFLDLDGNCQVTVPLWAAMYAAPLCPFKTLDAVLWVYGSTQSGKSTISHLALTHFGPGFVHGHAYHAPRDWTSSPTDLEGAMFWTKDIPIILDDYAPAHAGFAEARDLAKKSHYVVRSVGNRSSRGRSTPDLGERPIRPPRGLVVATAENPLVGQSIVGRMIYVPVEYGQVIREDNGKLDRAQARAEAGLYAQAMAGYIAWLIRNWDRLAKEVTGMLDQLNQEGRGIFPSDQSRLTDYYALLVVADWLALEYAASVGVLTTDEVEAKAKCHKETIVEVLNRQKERVSSQSPVLKYLMALADMMAQGRIYLHPKGSTEPDKERSIKVGWYDSESSLIYLISESSLAEVKTYWRAVDEVFDTGTEALHRELLQQGFARPGKDGRATQPKWINNEVKLQRVLVVDAQQVYGRLGLVLSDKVEAKASDEEPF
jgi:hypothetical protein